ncbi:hypothetical protein FB645_005762 [Coemansia sp. IMI 203386]|nr:hypothetical protein FB645_005762 [Coemansia sp. IMI 203386]
MRSLPQSRRMREIAQESALFGRRSFQDHATYTARSLVGMVLDYFSHTEYHPSPHQVEKDRSVFFGLIRCREWMVIPAGIIIQFCYGSVYAWSIFNAPINSLLEPNPDKGGAEITFYIALGVLGFTGALFGPWIESSHPRKSGTIGILVFYSGHLTTALALFVRMISLLYFGYGFVAGFGLGIGYVSTIEAVSKWWPKARGAAAGCAVMGFGGGALAFSYINKLLIQHTSLPSTFFILGSVNFVVMMFCLQFIAPPPPGHNLDGIQMVTDKDRVRLRGEESTMEEVNKSTNIHSLAASLPAVKMPLAEALKSRDFWLLYIAFMSNIMFCLVVLSNLPSMINRLFGRESEFPRDPPIPAYIAVSIEGGFNMFGRVMVGLVSDNIGRKATLLILLLTQIIILICVPITVDNGSFWWFLVLIWLATICYGGGFGMIPAFLSDMFGINNMSSCHGIILTGWSIASICGGLAFTSSINAHIKHGGKPYDTHIYFVNFMWMLALVILGFFCCLFVRSSIRDRLFPALPGQIIRMRVFGRVFRVLWTYDTGHSDSGECASSGAEKSNMCCLRFGKSCRHLHFEYLDKEEEQAAWEEYLMLRAVQSRLMQS